MALGTEPPIAYRRDRRLSVSGEELQGWTLYRGSSMRVVYSAKSNLCFLSK